MLTRCWITLACVPFLPPFIFPQVPSVCCCSVAKSCLFASPWTATHQASLFFTIFWSLLKPMSIESMMPSNHLILCRPLLLLPSVFPSIRVFSSLSALCIRWPKYWSFSISPSNEYSGLISFGIDWFDLLAVQGTPKSLLQHHSSKASNVCSCNGEGKKKCRTSQHCFFTPWVVVPLFID